VRIASAFAVTPAALVVAISNERRSRAGPRRVDEVEKLVIRTITGFHKDANGDWDAELGCLHSQHVRHRPPFQNRPWVEDSAQRQARVGSPIECPLCDRAETPDSLTLLRAARPWDQDTLPAGLRHSHRIAEGTWGMLRVTEGSVNFRMQTSPTSPAMDTTLSAGSTQPIPPEAPHEVTITGPVKLVVEFWGRPQ
jgi:tellurite resistance-related uncharacterized protein